MAFMNFKSLNEYHFFLLKLLSALGSADSFGDRLCLTEL